ncbi:DUF4426 domain-containing protein [Vreelandella olivaria]|uniref:DUF4426 domain-containing protein n=1 Tax=Vreelandella olivaria TaxID=390919 RepID=UPI00201EEAA1|nr:DUF4426 domain-containing protein [Halomonas olivaria]
MLRRLLLSMAFAATLLGTLNAHAEQFVQVGNYDIHYSAVSTSFLTPEVAQAHNIQRSANRGLVNVSVRERMEDGSTRPVSAGIQGYVSGLTGTQEPLSFRTVHDGDATYHLAPFTIRHDEAMRFEMDVRYDRNSAPETINFMQRFYIEY